MNIKKPSGSYSFGDTLYYQEKKKLGLALRKVLMQCMNLHQNYYYFHALQVLRELIGSRVIDVGILPLNTKGGGNPRKTDCIVAVASRAVRNFWDYAIEGDKDRALVIYTQINVLQDYCGKGLEAFEIRGLPHRYYLHEKI